MRVHPVLFAAAFVAMICPVICPAECQEITDIFSNIELSETTVDGDAAGYNLRLDLMSGSSGQVLQTRTLNLDGPGTWISGWRSSGIEKGPYKVCASLLLRDEVQSRRCYDLFYAGETPVRFDVRDFNADSRGMHLSILSADPTIVDIYYMLITGNKALYISKDESVSIASTMPLEIDMPWRQILEEGREYSGMVKIVEINSLQTRAHMKFFRALADASITETYEDETGASATVMGSSRVPFEGELQFILYQKGTELQRIEKKTPVLLAGKDETVEISWNRTLDPGIYQLRVILLGNKGDVKEVSESIIEAKPIVRPANSTQTQKSPMPEGIALLAIVAAALIRRMRA